MDRTPTSSDEARKLSLRKLEEQLKGSLEKILSSSSEENITRGGQLVTTYLPFANLECNWLQGNLSVIYADLRKREKAVE